jgi:hypothetical protein
MGLSPQEVITRRAFDDEVIRSMPASPILHVEGYRSLEDISAGRTTTAAEGARGKVLYYAAWYRFPVLVGPGQTTDCAVAVFNANVHGFPFTPPIAHITSKPKPWSPHVAPSSGIICQGDAWSRARGSMLLAHAIVHVARLRNCDEQDRSPDYVGYNAGAITYWRETMGCRPLNPGLNYPVPSVEVTHGIAAAEPVPMFRMLEGDTIEPYAGIQMLNCAQNAGFQLIGG